MTAQDLLKEAERHASPILQGHGALRKAVELFPCIESGDKADRITPILNLAERIRINSIRSSEDIYRLQDMVEITLQDLVASDYLVRQISPWVESIREELFGAAEPPFLDDLDSAVSWVETTATMDMNHRNPVTAALKKEVFRAADQEKTRVPFIMRDIIIPYRDKVKSIWVQPGTLLYTLSRKIDSIAGATGFSRHSMAVFFLTGLEPVLPRMTMSVVLGRADLPIGAAANPSDSKQPARRLSKRSLIVEIHSADLSPKELKMIYEEYRRALQVRKTKTLSRDQVKLYYLVTNAGGPPVQGSKAFWQETRERWNSDPKNRPYHSWEGVYQRYKIIEQKMNALFFEN